MYFYSFYSLSFLKNYNSSIAPFSSLSWALPCTTTWHNISLSLRMEMSSACLQVISTADLSHTENQTGNKIHMAPSMWQSAWDIIFDIHWDDLNSSLIASSFLSNALTQVHASKALSETAPFAKAAMLTGQTGEHYRPVPPASWSIPRNSSNLQSPEMFLYKLKTASQQ